MAKFCSRAYTENASPNVGKRTKSRTQDRMTAIWTARVQGGVPIVNPTFKWFKIFFLPANQAGYFLGTLHNTLIFGNFTPPDGVLRSTKGNWSYRGRVTA